MKTRRPVEIRLVGDSWMVLYLDRVKHGRYSAAGFYAKDSDYGKVFDWVMGRKDLQLVEPASQSRIH